ncbi:unnamed protein product [Peniophora sp. CBMAI 1063]|nr:unnamed protein product [Peniophora sp. CBMAI 1063]
MSVHQLPAELLLSIFEYASLDDQSTGQIPTSNYPGWTAVTRSDPSTSTNISQVCRRWRHLSLSDPMLWNRVPRSHESVTNTYLSRCSSALLDVMIDPYAHFWGPAKHGDAQKLEDYIPRARSLFISCRSSMGHGPPSYHSSSDERQNVKTFLEDFQPLSAPHLTELSMDLQMWFNTRARDTIPIPPHMFNGEPLRLLRSVKFNAVYMRQPQTFIWPALCCIELTDSRIWTHPDNFVPFFSGVPLLEELTSRNDGQARSSANWSNATPVQDLPPLRSVPMKHLKALTFHGPYRDMFLALAILDLPSSALLSFTLSGIWFADDQEEKVRIMHEAVQVHFAQAMQAGAYFDNITFDGRTMSATHPVQDSLSAHLPPSFTLSIPLLEYDDHDPGSQALELEALFAYTVFTRASTLTIHSVDRCGVRGAAHRLDSFYHEELEHMLALYVDVQALHVTGEDVCNCVANVLIQNELVPPNLAVLRMHGALFFSGAAHETNFVSTPLLLSSLLRLSERFKRLELERCELGEADVQQLREGLGEGRLSVMDCEIEG